MLILKGRGLRIRGEAESNNAEGCQAQTGEFKPRFKSQLHDFLTE
jgi:hypothetical protein